MSTEEKELNSVSDRAYIRRRRIVSAVSFGVFIALFGVLAWLIGPPLMRFVSNPEHFRVWVAEKGVWGPLTMIGLSILQVVVAVIPGEVFEIGAGYAFGAVWGMVLCLIGTAIGSVMIFLLTKAFGIRMVEAFVSREKINSLRFIRDSKKLNLLIFLLFFIPGTPKDVITYFIGITPIKLSTFLLISSVARIPSVISSTVGGHALGMQEYTFAIIVFAITAVVSVIGILIYNRISKHREKKKEQTGSAQEKKA